MPSVNLRVAREPFLERVAQLAAQAVVGEQLLDRLAPSRRFRDEHHAVLRLLQIMAQREQRFVGVTVDRESRQRHGPAAFGRRRKLQLREGLREREEIVVGQKEPARFEQGPLAVVREKVVALLRVVREALDRRIHVADERELRAFRQIVEERRGFVEKERQIVFDARRRHAVADVLVNLRAARIALEHFAPAAAEGGARGFVERKLAARQQTHVAHGVEAALRVGIERADGVHLIVEQVDAIGQRRAHRIQVDERAAHAVFARPHDLAHVLVARERQLRLELGFVEPLALRERERVGREKRRGRHAIERRRRGHDQNVATAFAEIVQRRETFRHEILVRRERVVRQRFPVGQKPHARVGREEGDFGGETLRIDGARGQTTVRSGTLSRYAV